MSPDGRVEAYRIWKRFRPDRAGSAIRAQIEFLRDRFTGTGMEWQWALREVSLTLEPGESIGLVGNNGSGKSTLLKILTRVMYPHTGRVEVTGRVGALIEVRAGIHPDLTGRENVFLYGTLLGLSRLEVTGRFDEIVAFAQLEDSIDRQVKFYSSGMQMRLGFAVAAFLEPDVLLVDEVLAVGDQSFQQRCLDRMRYVLSQGTTLVYVSHDLATVEAICQRGLWLDLGVTMQHGPVREVVQAYKQSVEEASEIDVSTGPVRLMKVQIGDGHGLARTLEALEVTIALEADQQRAASVFLGVSEGTSHPIFVVKHDTQLEPGQSTLICTLPSLPLPHGRFYLWIGVLDHGRRDLVSWRPAGHLDVMGPNLIRPPLAVVRPARVYVEATWRDGG